MIAKNNIIISRPSIVQNRDITKEASFKVKNLMIFSKGSTKITAKLDKDSYNVGETAHIECFVDNSNSD